VKGGKDVKVAKNKLRGGIYLAPTVIRKSKCVLLMAICFSSL
jgi:hypothetical protein